MNVSPEISCQIVRNKKILTFLINTVFSFSIHYYTLKCNSGSLRKKRQALNFVCGCFVGGAVVFVAVKSKFLNIDRNFFSIYFFPHGFYKLGL
jgi:uncharacterized membrane protein